MPHIIIEHDKKTAQEYDLSKLTHSLHHTLAEQETISLEAIKTRTILADNVIVADGSKNKILHIEVLLLTGRSTELKESMAEALFKSATKYIDVNNCSLTVNIAELGVYRK